jgi:cyanate permease
MTRGWRVRLKILLLLSFVYLFVWVMGECRGKTRVLSSAEETLWNTRQDWEDRGGVLGK